MGKDIVKMTNGSFVFLFLFGCSGDRPSQSEATVENDSPCPAGSVFKEGLPADDVLCDDCKVSACVTADGTKHGPWFEYHPDGRIKTEGQYEGGQKNGKWRYWYRNGQQEEEARYVNGKRNGKWTMWYESGELWREHQYKDDALHGERTDWKPDGTVFSKRLCNELPCDPTDGVHMEWHSNGQLFISGEFMDSKMNGKWSYRTEGGTIRMSEQCDLIADRLTGECKPLCDSVEACAKMKD